MVLARINDEFVLTRPLNLFESAAGTAPIGTRVKFIGDLVDSVTHPFVLTMHLYEVTEGSLRGYRLQLIRFSQAEASLTSVIPYPEPT